MVVLRASSAGLLPIYAGDQESQNFQEGGHPTWPGGADAHGAFS